MLFVMVLISFQLLRSTCCSLVKSDKTPLMIATFPGKRAANKDFKEKRRREKRKWRLCVFDNRLMDKPLITPSNKPFLNAFIWLWEHLIQRFYWLCRTPQGHIILLLMRLLIKHQKFNKCWQFNCFTIFSWQETCVWDWHPFFPLKIGAAAKLISD